MTVRCRNLETETLACQSAVLYLEAQLAQIRPTRRMTDVERQKSNTPQAEVLCHGAENLQIPSSLNRSKEEVAPLPPRCNEFWRTSEPTQCARDEACHSQELE